MQHARVQHARSNMQHCSMQHAACNTQHTTCTQHAALQVCGFDGEVVWELKPDMIFSAPLAANDEEKPAARQWGLLLRNNAICVQNEIGQVGPDGPIRTPGVLKGYSRGTQGVLKGYSRAYSSAYRPKPGTK